MSFESLKRRVERSERVLEGRIVQTQSNWRGLTNTWRESWTPLRIVVAGLLGGFVLGRSDPVATLGKFGALGGNGTRVLQLVSMLSGLFASLQASSAAEEAEKAADTAEEVVADAQPGSARADVPRPQSPPRPIGEPVAPRPAEAATEVSEGWR